MNKSLVSIVRYEKPLDSVRKAVDLCKGLDHLPSKAKVFIKPNIVWWTKETVFPKWGIITTSRIVENMVVLLKELGIDEIVIGEGMVIEPKDRETPRQAYETLGYNVLKRRYGVKCFNIHERPFEKVDIGSGEELNLNLDFLECDFLVDIPVLKTHFQTVVSLGIKNIKGLIDIESRKKCHSTEPGMDLHHYVSRLAAKIPPSLTLVDGIYSNEIGPHFSGNIRRSNLLIASPDMLAADKVGAKILGYDPSQVPHLVLTAKDKGRPIDFSDVETVGEKIDKVATHHEFTVPYNDDKKLPEVLAGKGIDGISLGNIDLSLCTYCAGIYPALYGALAMAWQGEPYDDVEVLAGKVQKPTPGKKKTILFGRCIYQAHKDNTEIREMIPVKGCPPTAESIRKAFAKAGIELNTLFGNISAAMGFMMGMYKGRPEFEESLQILDASEHAGVGHSIGMAIGAALGDPDTKNHPIISLMGDGGVGVAGFDIETALRYELPIVYLITNNDGWLTGLKYNFYGKEWNAMGPQDRRYGHEFLPGIKYDKLSEVIGTHGEYVEKPEEFRPALERALKSAEEGKTAVVNVRVDPTLVSPAMHSIGIQATYGHIPWDELPKRGKALRRFYHFMFPWDEAGVPPVQAPDPWDPVSEDDMEP